MTNKILSTLAKPLFSKIVWIGGATAGITVVLSAIGFLVLRSHYELLGITGLVPTPSDTWTVEGARFVYNSIFYIVAGLFGKGLVLLFILVISVLIVVAANDKWLSRIHMLTKYHVVQVSIIILTFVGLTASLYFFVKDEAVSYLLVHPPSKIIQQAITLRTTDTGIQSLRLHYAGFAAFVVFFFVYLKLLPSFFPTKPGVSKDDSTASSDFPIWYGVQWFLFLILLLLLPMKYGRMARSNKYFKVCLLTSPQINEINSSPGISCSGYEGWLLHKDSQHIVMYQGVFKSKPIQIFKQDQFPHIQVMSFDSIFSEALSQSVTPPQSFSGPSATSPSFSQSVLTMGKVLRDIPKTVAAGMLTRERGITLLRTLVIANANGTLLDTFTLSQADETAHIQSPIWLPDGRILFVEVHGITYTLKVVPSTFDSEDNYFGSSPIQGMEPHLTPDKQFIIFRQSTKIMRTDLSGTTPTLLLQHQQLDQLLGIFPEPETTIYYLVFSEKPPEIKSVKLWIVKAQGSTIISKVQLSSDPDSYSWMLLPKIKMKGNKMLYEYQDEVGGKRVWNIYLTESFEQEGRQITNTSSGGELFNNRYPSWSSDGTKIVYASN